MSAWVRNVTIALKIGMLVGVGGWWFMWWQERSDPTIDMQTMLYLPVLAWLCFLAYVCWVGVAARGELVWPFTALMGLVMPFIVIAGTMIALSLAWGGISYVRRRRTERVAARVV